MARWEWTAETQKEFEKMQEKCREFSIVIDKFRTNVSRDGIDSESMEEELENIGWDLEGVYKDLWESANNRLRSEAHKLSFVNSMAKFLKNFRVDPN